MRSAYPILFLCALACASGPSAARLSSTGTAPLATSVAGSGATVTRGTILTGNFTTEYFSGETLYDVLRRRVPLYLRTRPDAGDLLNRGSGEISVFINGLFSGSLDVLELIPAHDVFAVDRIGSTEAAVKLGPKHANGALMVTLVRRD